MKRLQVYSALLVVTVFVVADSRSSSAQSSTLFGGGGSRNQSTGTNTAAGAEETQSRLQSLSDQAGEGTGGTTGTGFVGRSDNAGRFVGAATQETRGQQQQTQTQTRNFGGRGNFGGFGGNNNFFNQLRNSGAFGRTTSQNRGVFRPQQRIAFAYSKPSTAKVSTTITRRFTRMSTRRPEFAAIKFELDDAGIVTLRGVVDSESAKRLAASMTRLQPGVRTVRNELTIEEATSSGG